jgi:hypothetical protein
MTDSGTWSLPSRSLHLPVEERSRASANITDICQVGQRAAVHPKLRAVLRVDVVLREAADAFLPRPS